jgi:hypothetical protein
MKFLVIDIVEYTQNDFPGWVRCKLIDSMGKEHYFNEKVPIVSVENINKNTTFPQKGYIRGEIIEVVNKKHGIIAFGTLKPDGVESENGNNLFLVYESQIIIKEGRV